MDYAFAIIMVALLQYIYFCMMVGFNRGKCNVPAPKVSGNEHWERLYRVQQNSLEQLIIFIPSVLAFSYYVSALWALCLGVAYVVGRQIYSYLYLKNPASRGVGFAMSFFSNVALVVGGLIGAVIAIVS